MADEEKKMIEGVSSVSVEDFENDVQTSVHAPIGDEEMENGFRKEINDSMNDEEVPQFGELGDEKKVESNGTANGSVQGPGNDIEASAPARPTPPPNAVPNGGLTAWLQVLGSFFLMMNSWGILNSFGVYQSYYEASILSHETPSNISWIGSIQAFLLLLISCLTGPLFDAGYFRHLVAVGSFLIVFGMMMTSIAREYWEIMLAQAFCIGLGAGCLFVPGVSILPTYFSTRKALATGIAVSGSSLGGVLYPIIFYKLEPRIGFGWATRVIGFIALATLSVSAVVMKVRVLPPAKRRLFMLSPWKEPAYTLFTIGMIFSFTGFYFPMFYIQSYAMSKHITTNDLGFYLLAILNGASLFGRIIPNWLADRYGPLNVIAPGAIITAALAYAWMGIQSTGGLIVFAILYGFSSGCFVSLPPTVVVTLTKNMSEIGTRIGMSVAAASFGVLIGNPIAGQLVKHDGFNAGIAFSASTVAVGAVMMVSTRIAKSGYKVKAIA